MRVITGTARGKKLKTLENLDIRPTSDMVKEAIFSIIQFDVPGSSVLDLFAGSGQLGIEALSRGAEFAAFVEQNPKAVMCIRENLKATKLEAKANVYATDVISALRRMEGKEKFDYIFMDPPYNQLHEKRVLEYLSNSTLLSADGIIIVEASLETDFSYVDELGFVIVKEKIYKTNKHIFLEKEAF